MEVINLGIGIGIGIGSGIGVGVGMVLVLVFGRNPQAGHRPWAIGLPSDPNHGLGGGTGWGCAWAVLQPR